MAYKKPDMSLWQGRVDPEADSFRWHQKVTPLELTGLGTDSGTGIALLGFACDEGVRRNKGRTGAVNGPRAIRRALAPIAWHRTGPVVDAGDVYCEGEALDEAQNCLASRVSRLLATGYMPVVLGGGHEVAYGSWCGLADYLEAQGGPVPRIAIINLDAHLDLRDSAFVQSSGTPFSQIAESCEGRGWPFHYGCLGVSRASNTKALFQRARNLNVLIREDHELRDSNLGERLTELGEFISGCDHVYLTIDIDVLPAAEAPGVSAPAAHGVTLSLLEPIVKMIRDSGKLRLVDIAELNPELDIDNRTARAAARLIQTATCDLVREQGSGAATVVA